MSRLCEPCLSVSKEIPALLKCVDCVELYCEKCSEDHTKFRAFQKHTLVGLKQITPANFKIRDYRKCPFSANEHHRPTESIYENVILATGEKSLDSGSDESNASEKKLNAVSGVQDVAKKTLFVISDDLDADKKQLYAGSDDLDADKKQLCAGSDDLDDPTAKVVHCVRFDPCGECIFCVENTTGTLNGYLQKVRCHVLEQANYNVRDHRKCPLSANEQHRPTESIYENVILATGVTNIELEGAATGETSLDSGSDESNASEKKLNAVSGVQDAAKKTLFVISDDLDADKKQLCAGSDDLDTHKKTLYAGSDDLDEDKKTLYAGSDDLDKGMLYSGSDDLDADTKKIYAGSEELSEPQYSSAEDSDEPVNHFFIYVDITPLSRAMGIQGGQRCMLVICKETLTFSVSINGKQIFEGTLGSIKSYKYKGNLFTIEFGKGFKFGPGLFQFETVNSKEISSLFKEIGSLHTSKVAVFKVLQYEGH